MRTFVVAIDGTAGSGKSTTALNLARELDFFYLDTGAMYRVFTLNLIRRGFSLDPIVIKETIARTKIDLLKKNDHYQVTLNGEDVTIEIRNAEVNEKVSQVSALPVVREWMVRRQREIAQGKSVVCEGRDIGTVVFPDAEIKIYMQASLEERARRRLKELDEKGFCTTFEEVLKNLSFRDNFDTKREHSPLRCAEDAIIIDTTNLTIEQELERALVQVRKRLARQKIS